jgi:hypothetical protein
MILTGNEIKLQREYGAEVWNAKEEEGGNPMTRKEILAAAEKCVCEDRNKEYSEPEDIFSLIAALWEPVIRARCVPDGTYVCMDETTVALLMALLKIARASVNQEHIDSWIDLAGYAACGGELATLGGKD